MKWSCTLHTIKNALRRVYRNEDTRRIPIRYAKQKNYSDI